MIKKLLLTLLFASSFAQAELKPFINLDLGLSNTRFDNNVFLGIGGGLQFNDNVEIEVAHNEFGDVGPFGVNITSQSFGLNIGGRIAENTRMFAIIGSERLKAKDTVQLSGFSISLDESSNEAFFGIGWAFEKDNGVSVRVKLIGHDSADVRTLTVGFAKHF